VALPNQLRSARATDATDAGDIDTVVGAIEQAVCDILGVTIDADIATAIFGTVDSQGRPSSIRIAGAAATNELRLRDTTNDSECKLACNNGYLRVYQNTGTEAVPVWTERNKMDLATGIWSVCPQGGNMLYAAVCRASGVQSIPGSVWTELVWTAADEFDPADMHNVTESPTRIDIKQAGWYFIVAQGHFDSIYSAGDRGLKILANREVELAKWYVGPAYYDTSGDDPQICLEVQAYLNAGSFVSVYVYQGTTLPQDFDPFEFSAVLIGAY